MKTLIFLSALLLASCTYHDPKCEAYIEFMTTFNDDKGNVIPQYAVQLLVEYQFETPIEQDWQDTLSKYFPNY